MRPYRGFTSFNSTSASFSSHPPNEIKTSLFSLDSRWISSVSHPNPLDFSFSICLVHSLTHLQDEAAERRERRTKRRFDEACTSVQHRDPWPRDDKTPIATVESVERLRFMPDAQFLRDLPAIPRRPPGVRRARATQGPPEAPLPDFPNIPDIPMRDQGDFQRVVVDALRAIWARVSCTSRRTIRAHSPAAAGRSRQRRDPSSESDDETSEDTD
ncbi:hypothetical protein F2Q69_00028568 [Brassica cretica]|uniref:Uncharacterized protein n=1 Tax=Brassica cretica TaxID=69181 RepID=A0A8S9RUK4_BRACR|nr:hypothetical protein F2Q69_00028568 [Brassica cretica]